jgi:outer membrane lipoprotein-sorting protein
MKTRWSLLLLNLSLTLLPPDAGAQTPDVSAANDRGAAIAREADARDSGWGNAEARLRMVLKNRHGQESLRTLDVRFLEMAQDGDKSLGYFHEPADVKGTALLTYSHKTESDDQWLYLPALKRVKRIASADKSGAFMGSEFAYEDLSSQEVEKYTYTHVKDEALDGEDCFVIERVPTAKYSGYTRQVVWIDKSAYRTRKVDYYDRKGSLLKTLTAGGYTVHLERYWRAGWMLMQNHQNGKSTRLEWSGFRFQAGFKDTDFTQEALKRAS